MTKNIYVDRDPSEVDLRFQSTECIVEADDFARLELWVVHASDGGQWTKNGQLRTELNCIEWKQDNPGTMICVGEIQGMPINICCFWNFLNGRRVMFYHACSMVVHYGMVEEWLKKFVPCMNLGRHYDAMNFGGVISYLQGR